MPKNMNRLSFTISGMEVNFKLSHHPTPSLNTFPVDAIQFCLQQAKIVDVIFEHISHYENTPIQIYGKFHHQKLKVFR